MKRVLLVGMGGFIGSAGRYLLGIAFVSLHSNITTMLINISGAIIISFITEISSKAIEIPSGIMLFLTVGICGGFTTFSTFSMQTFGLLEKGRYITGIGYAVASVLLCLLGIWAGKVATQVFLKMI